MPVIKIKTGESGQMQTEIEGVRYDVGLMRREVSENGLRQKPKGLPPIPRWYHGSFLDIHTRFGEFFDRDNEIY